MSDFADRIIAMHLGARLAGVYGVLYEHPANDWAETQLLFDTMGVALPQSGVPKRIRTMALKYERQIRRAERRGKK